MPVEISVGPPVLTINQGGTFVVSELNGEIAAGSEQGVFAGDTRYMSFYALFANGKPWTRLTGSLISHFAARVFLINRAFPTEEGNVPAGVIGLTLGRAVGEGIHECIDVTNHSLEDVRFNLEIVVRADFADIFEVKSHHFVRRGRIETEWNQAATELRTSYTSRDFRRALVCRYAHSDSPPHYSNGRITFDVALRPGGSWHTCCEYLLIQNDRVRAPTYGCDYLAGDTAVDELHRQWQARATGLTSANEDIYRLYRQSVDDMGALRLYDMDLANDVWIAAAGVPWFVTLFGRDSLIVSLQNMLVNPGFARGALRTLAQYQATEHDEWRDAEPGKILHEMRVGELAQAKKIPHTPYYGTADATPLYLIVLHEAWKWSGDDALLRDYRDVALRCLEWIDRYGDLDGDGFQEYRTRSTLGYENVGWKDASDAVVYPNGTQVKQPKALCELQGYVFDAWMRMAEAFDFLGEPARGRELRAKAAALRVRFEERFWCEDIGCYAFGLDPDKNPIKTIASNAGHCLWSGIASPEHAARVVERFLRRDMWSGWGIRTLSADHPAYNPFSYQLGSVWPHDNGIIALGFKRYGFAAEAARIARDISEAASDFVGYRLPELYAGVERRPGAFPVQYLGANVPQAWAAGSVFHLLQAMLGIRADAPNGVMYLDAELPRWLPDVVLHGLQVGAARLDLRVWREGDRTRWDASIREGRIEIVQDAWAPWR